MVVVAVVAEWSAMLDKANGTAGGTRLGEMTVSSEKAVAFNGTATTLLLVMLFVSIDTDDKGPPPCILLLDVC